MGSRDQLNQELSTCRAALDAANADNERLRSSHKSNLDSAIGEAQEARNEALPFGTRGGLEIDGYFPLSGEYEFAVQTASTSEIDATSAASISSMAAIFQ